MMHLHDDIFSTLDPCKIEQNSSSQPPEPIDWTPYSQGNPWRDKLHELRQLEIEQEALAKRLKAIDLRKHQILELSPAGHASQKRANKVAERYGFSGAQRSDP